MSIYSATTLVNPTQTRERSPSVDSKSTVSDDIGTDIPLSDTKFTEKATRSGGHIFRQGDEAWALGGNHKWRRVTILDSGDEERRINGVWYTATWTKDGLTYRGRFSPLRGELKPDTKHIRTLVADLGPKKVEDWELLRKEVEIEYLEAWIDEKDLGP